jgi:hypothetical protein
MLRMLQVPTKVKYVILPNIRLDVQTLDRLFSDFSDIRLSVRQAVF